MLDLIALSFMCILASPAAPQDFLQEQAKAVLEFKSMTCHGQLRTSGLDFKDEPPPRAIDLDEQRKAYRMFEAKVKGRIIGEKKKGFPPDVVRAYEIVAADERPGFQAANPSITPDLRRVDKC